MNTNDKKIKVVLMFYPISWDRYRFDNMTPTEVISDVVSLGAGSVKFVDWCDVSEWNNNEISHEQDCFNDWDDLIEDDFREEMLKNIENCGIDEQFVKEHWCRIVTKEMADSILQNSNEILPKF